MVLDGCRNTNKEVIKGKFIKRILENDPRPCAVSRGMKKRGGRKRGVERCRL